MKWKVKPLEQPWREGHVYKMPGYRYGGTSRWMVLRVRPDGTLFNLFRTGRENWYEGYQANSADVSGEWLERPLTPAERIVAVKAIMAGDSHEEG